jgi:hypothetical protein
MIILFEMGLLLSSWLFSHLPLRKYIAVESAMLKMDEFVALASSLLSNTAKSEKIGVVRVQAALRASWTED